MRKSGETGAYQISIEGSAEKIGNKKSISILMTKRMRIVANYLFDGNYIRISKNIHGTDILLVYDNSCSTICYVPLNKAKPLFRLLKMDKRTGKLTLNLTIVRRQHGKTWIKKRYKELYEAAKMERRRKILQSHDLPAGSVPSVSNEG